MKIENLERAKQLSEDLKMVNSNIKDVEKSDWIRLGEGDQFGFKLYIPEMVKMVKPLFLEHFNKQKQDILAEIEQLD